MRAFLTGGRLARLKHSRSRPTVNMALTAIIVALVSACSGLGSTATTSGGTRSLLQEIHQRGELRVGVASAQPYVYKDPKTGEWVGTMVAVMQDWASTTLKVKFVTVSTTWDNQIAGLQAHQYDLSVGLNERPARALAVTYSNPVAIDLDAFAFFPSKTHVSSWADVDDPKNSVCVQAGSAEDLALTNSPPKLQIIRLPDQTACRLALTSGRVNFLIDDWGAQGPFAKANPGVSLIFPTQPIVNEGSGYAIDKGYSFDDVQALNIQIASFIERGLMAKANLKYEVTNPLPYAVSTIPTYVQQAATVQFPGG